MNHIIIALSTLLALSFFVPGRCGTLSRVLQHLVTVLKVSIRGRLVLWFTGESSGMLVALRQKRKRYLELYRRL